MFYMFSGPDFLYADAFYSKASTYVLSALEPVGSVPDLTRLPRGGIGAALHNVERSLSSILSFSFFITKQMKTDLQAGQLSGTLPILYVFLARSGKTIRDVSPIALDDKGAAYFANENPGPNATRGVRILFAGSDGAGKDAVLFLDRSFQQRRQGRGLPEILRDAGARQQPDQERVLSAAFRATSPPFATSFSPTAPPSFRTIPAYRLPITIRGNGGFFPFGRYARSDRRIPGTRAAGLCRTVPARAADGFRHRLSLAHA